MTENERQQLHLYMYNTHTHKHVHTSMSDWELTNNCSISDGEVLILTEGGQSVGYTI